MNKKISVILSLMFLFISSSIFAEIIALKSGKTIEGKIFEQTDKYIKVDIEGVPVTYYLDGVTCIDTGKVKIYFEDVEDLKMTEEESLRELAKKYKNDGKNTVVLKNGIKLFPFRITREQGAVMLMFRGDAKNEDEYERADMFPLNEIETINGIAP